MIIAIQKHNLRDDEFVVLGREGDDPTVLDNFFTRRANWEGHQFSGDYRLTLSEAVKDFEDRKVS